MESNVKLSKAEDTIVISLHGTSIDDLLSDVHLEMVSEFFEEMMRAGQAIEDLDASTFAKRSRAIAAQDLRIQMLLNHLQEHARLLHRIVAGRETLGSHGFPEFDDE